MTLHLLAIAPESTPRPAGTAAAYAEGLVAFCAPPGVACGFAEGVPALAAAPGEAIGDLAEAQRLLIAEAGALCDALSRFGLWREWTLDAHWLAPAALSRFREAPEVRAGRAGAIGQGRRAVAAALWQGMARVRDRLGVAIAASVSAIAEASRALPPGDPDCVARLALALEPGRGEALRGLAQSLAADWPEGLRIGVEGPRLAQSFASVRLQRIADGVARRSAEARVRAARSALGPVRAVEGVVLAEIAPLAA